MKTQTLSLAFVVLLLTACTTRQVGMANIASVYCVEQGFKSEIRTAPDGSQSGVCIFPDGNECDEWAFFRGECKPGQPVDQTDAASHSPVILRVEEREEIQNGRLVIIKDIYFTDPEGDATTIVNTLVATDPAELTLPIGDDAITTPAEEQKLEGLAASPLRCSSTLIPYSLTIEDRIRDAAGNLSEPITIVFACPADPPNSLPFVIAAIIIGLGLLAGFWLYFRKHPSERPRSFSPSCFWSALCSQCTSWDPFSTKADTPWGICSSME